MLHIKPDTFTKSLQAGDEVTIVAASSIINDKSCLEEGLNILHSWGLICQKHNVIGRQWGYLAGDDLTRFKELHSNNHGPLIAFARGGWGAARLLERHQPWVNGWLLGYSDITSILLSRLSSGFDGSIHGPLITSLAKEPRWSQERLKALLFGNPVSDIYGTPWKKGIAKGPVVVANLTVASHLIGSKHLPDLNGAILILEDVDEAPYRIDRMLTQWRLSGLLQGLAGLGFGKFKNCENNQDPVEELHQSFQLTEVLQERSLDLNIPIVADLPIGHFSGNAALPLGRQVILNGNTGSLKLIT